MDYSVNSEFQYKEAKDEIANLYIQNRLLVQINWYDKKSSQMQIKYKRLSITAIIITALIPIATLLLNVSSISFFIQILIALLSSVASIISSILALCKYKELWIQYRSNCELLKSVLHRFYTKSGEFSNKSDKSAFEQHCTKEFDNWNDIYSKDIHSSIGS